MLFLSSEAIPTSLILPTVPPLPAAAPVFPEHHDQLKEEMNMENKELNLDEMEKIGGGNDESETGARPLQIPE